MGWPWAQKGAITFLLAGFATLGCAYSIWSRIGVPGLVGAGAFVLLAVWFRFRRKGGTA